MPARSLRGRRRRPDLIPEAATARIAGTPQIEAETGSATADMVVAGSGATSDVLVPGDYDSKGDTNRCGVLGRLPSQVTTRDDVIIAPPLGEPVSPV